MQLQKHGMSEFPHYGTSMGKKDNSQVSLNLTYLELVETHGIPNAWECANSHDIEIFCGKTYYSQAMDF